MQDLATTDDRELHSALRLLLNEWIVRYAIPRSDLQESLDGLMSHDGGMPWPVELTEDPGSKELYAVLTASGWSYALLSGRLERGYVAQHPVEDALLRRLRAATDVQFDRE